jgi:predicted methyltransferase
MNLRKVTSRTLAGIALIAGALAAGLSQLLAQNNGPARDTWQRPEEVMDQLGIHAGSRVADVGCGKGYFTFHLARRVGPQGKVYAEDIDSDVLASVEREARKNGFNQVETVAGSPDDPHLPPGSVDVVLVVNSYHEWRDYNAMLQGLFRALKPGGLLGLIDAEAPTGRPRSEYYERHRMPEAIEREDAERNGFHFLRRAPGFIEPDMEKHFYFLIFEKPRPS